METDTQNYSLIRPQTTRGESTLEIKGGSIQVAFAKSRPASDFAGITYNAGTPKITVPTGYKLWIKANSAAVSISDGVYNPPPLPQADVTGISLRLGADPTSVLVATWNALPDADTYEIKITNMLISNGNAVLNERLVTTQAQSHLFENLTQNTSYKLQVRALTNLGRPEGSFDETATQKTAKTESQIIAESPELQAKLAKTKNIGTKTAPGYLIPTSRAELELLAVLNNYLLDSLTEKELQAILEHRNQFIFTLWVGDRRKEFSYRTSSLQNWSGQEGQFIEDFYTSDGAYFQFTLSLFETKIALTELHSGQANQFGAIHGLEIKRK